MWSTEKGITGLKFVDLDDSSRTALTEFITLMVSMKDTNCAAAIGAATGT